MDYKKICFIICANDDRCVEECLYYINNLVIPEGYTIDCITIADAVSMTSGYNEGMAATDARIKIYMHQDVLILNRDFLKNIIEIFEDRTIGMIGMVGAVKLPENAIMWYGKRVGCIRDCTIYGTQDTRAGENCSGYEVVEAIDGLLMATQYDIPWREDLFDGWDFYDVSQSFEFRRAGYRVVVPGMDKPWCLHDDDLLNLRNYFKYRELFINEYLR